MSCCDFSAISIPFSRVHGGFGPEDAIFTPPKQLEVVLATGERSPVFPKGWRVRPESAAGVRDDTRPKVTSKLYLGAKEAHVEPNR